MYANDANPSILLHSEVSAVHNISSGAEVRSQCMLVDHTAGTVDGYSWMMWLAAPLCGVVYFALARVVGEVFPFSRYGMYATTAKRSEGGVPLFIADGTEARIDDYRDFAGIDPESIYPSSIPCSLEWRVREWQRWLRHHRSERDGEGPVRIEIGFRMLRIDADGKIVETRRITQRGTAWPA